MNLRINFISMTLKYLTETPFKMRFKNIFVLFLIFKYRILQKTFLGEHITIKNSLHVKYGISIQN